MIVSELRHGCANKASPRLTARIDAILRGIPVMAFEAPADAGYASIRTGLETVGTTIGPNDLLIAAHAVVPDAILVTTNVGEFERVRSLRIDSWPTYP